MLLVTVSAVHRTVTAWLERHLCLGAAIRAGSDMHFTHSAATASSAATGAALCAVLGEAVLTIHRPVAAWFKGNLSDITAVGACCVKKWAIFISFHHVSLSFL